MDVDEDEDPFGAFGCFGFNGLSRGPRRAPEPLYPRRKVQDPPVVHELRVSLEEIYHGSTKRMKITRRRLNPDGRTVRTEDKILHIVIKRGWKEGTKITFPKEGDATPDNIPADIVFVLKDKPHAHFRRDGTNVLYSALISLKEVGPGSNCMCVYGWGVAVMETFLLQFFFPSQLLYRTFSSFSVSFSPGTVWLHREHSHH